MPWRRLLIAIVPSLLTAVSVQAAGPLNDTGIVTCGDASNNELPCPVADYPGQDAEYGRDVTHNDPSDGHAGFSFTKLDANGNDLPASATDWSCVRDNVTGLIWEVKTTDGGFRDMGWKYSWYNPDSGTNGGDPGMLDGGTCAGSACDTQGYVQAVNEQGLCGASDWRMPTRRELLSIISNNRTTPAIDTNYFPNTPSNGYSLLIYFWSSSPVAVNSDYAWVVDFNRGAINQDGGYERKAYSNRVRLVRSGE
jgi:hypothetical protein